MREVTFRVRHHEGPECAASAAFPDVTMRSVSSMTGRENARKRIVELRGPTASIRGFLDAFREADAVVEAEPLSPVAGDHAYVTVEIDAREWDGIGDRLAEMGIHYRTGTTISAGVERWTVYIDPDDDLAAIRAELERGGNEVELARNVALSGVERPARLSSARFLEELTPRQREVLATAVTIGYYDHGGGVGVEAVAEELGLATTTVWEHLSRAEATVMNGLVDRLEV